MADFLAKEVYRRFSSPGPQKEKQREYVIKIYRFCECSKDFSKGVKVYRYCSCCPRKSLLHCCVGEGKLVDRKDSEAAIGSYFVEFKPKAEAEKK